MTKPERLLWYKYHIKKQVDEITKAKWQNRNYKHRGIDYLYAIARYPRQKKNHCNKCPCMKIEVRVDYSEAEKEFFGKMAKSIIDSHLNKTEKIK